MKFYDAGEPEQYLTRMDIESTGLADKHKLAKLVKAGEITKIKLGHKKVVYKASVLQRYVDAVTQREPVESKLMRTVKLLRDSGRSKQDIRALINKAFNEYQNERKQALKLARARFKR